MSSKLLLIVALVLVGAVGILVWAPWRSEAPPPVTRQMPPPVARVVAAGDPAAGEEEPPQPQEPRGTVLDVKAYPALAKLTTTLVDVHIDGEKASDAIAHFSTATPYKNLLPVWDEDSTMVTLNLNHVPAMQAFMEFKSQVYYLNGGFSAYEITAGYQGLDKNGIGKYCIAGPFATTVDSLERVIALDAPQYAQYPVALRMRLFAEPGLRMRRAPNSIIFDEAVNENHIPIKVVGRESISFATDLQRGMEFPVRVSTESSGGNRIAILKGHIPAKVTTIAGVLETKAPTSLLTQEIMGVKVTATPRTGDATPGGTVTFILSYENVSVDPGQWQAVSRRLVDAGPHFYLADGRDFSGSVRQTDTRPTPQSVEVTYRLPVAPAGAADHLTLTLLSLDTDVDIPFEFRNINLP